MGLVVTLLLAPSGISISLQILVIQHDINLGWTSDLTELTPSIRTSRMGKMSVFERYNTNSVHHDLFLDIKFTYFEKATKFCEIFPLLLTVCTVVKSKGKISQNFVAFSEYMNFNRMLL